MKSTEDDFADFLFRQRSQIQNEITDFRKVPVTVRAYCDADEVIRAKKKTEYIQIRIFFFIFLCLKCA